MIKRRKIFQRAAALLCCIILLPSLVVVPASAENMGNFMDLVDAGYFEETIYKLSPTENRIEISFGDYTLMKYIDFVFSRSSTTPKRIYVVSGYDGSKQQLYTESIGNNMFRAYGLIGVHSSTLYYLEFETTGTTYIYPYTCKVSLNTGSAFPDVGKMFVSDGHNFDTYYEMDAPNSSVTADFWYPNTLDNPYTYQYISDIWIDNWIKYDYIVVQFSISDANLNSLCCYLDDSYVPFDISVIGDVDLFQYEANESGGVIRYFPNGLDSVIHVSMRIDLTEVFRSNNSELAVHITGQYSTQDSFICLNSVTGYLTNDVTETDTLWIKLKKLLNDLFGEDPAADHAQQTQEQVDQEVNVHITQAVADWETNIVYAETGFTSGLSLVTPSVAWISLLASRIFDNMNGFGAIYVLVGFMSVIMLLLSKSGIAAKISNRSRGAPGGKK